MAAKRNAPLLLACYAVNFFCTWIVIQGLLHLQHDPATESAKTDASPQHQKKIVVIAQGRSGSSFVSSWFGADPDVLYFIEPCSATYLKAYRGNDFTGRNCARVLGELLSCNFSSVDVNRDQRPFIPELAVGFKGWGHQSKKSLKACKTQKAIAVKEIRTGMAWATYYRGARKDAETGDGFVNVPLGFSSSTSSRERADVKYLVLVRDPRAVFASRKDWPKPSPSGTSEDEATEPRGYSAATHNGFPYMQPIRSMCLEHLALRRRVAAEAAGGGVMLVEYARVLNEPIKVMEEVFEFVGMAPVPSHVRSFVEKNVQGDCQHVDSPFSVCRKTQLRGESGEFKPDEKWKKELTPERLAELLSFPECKEIVDRFYSSPQPYPRQQQEHKTEAEEV